MKKNKAFTLMELLAVIIILAIIALIATPLVLNIITNSRLKSFKESVNNIIKSAENGYSIKLFDNHPALTIVSYQNNLKTIEGNIEIEYKGDNPEEGKLLITSEGKIVTSLYKYGHCAYKTFNTDKVVLEKMKKEDCNINKLISLANPPILSSGMTPIKWDENNNEMETTTDDPNWYNYEDKKWANVKTKDGSYFVWIPRYAYKIKENYHQEETGIIDIIFLLGNTNDNLYESHISTSGYNVNANNTSNNYFVHPAFDNNQYGFWVAKFEPTAVEGISNGRAGDGYCPTQLDNVNSKTILIAPNKISWRCINIKNAYNNSLLMKNKDTIYGWKKEEVETYLMTNKMWGSIAYLTQSEFGANTDIWVNNSNNYTTGCGGNSFEETLSSSNCLFNYKTTNGMKTSTTHNITGIYDMSGSGYQFVMANYNNISQNSGMTPEEIKNINTNHIDNYTSNDILGNFGFNYDTLIYGDAIYETSNNPARWNGIALQGNSNSSWNYDHSQLPWVTEPFFVRGGQVIDGVGAGIFAYYRSDGKEASYFSFRPVVSMLKNN